MPSAWGHTRLLETDWRFITQESHCFSCGSVKRRQTMEKYVASLTNAQGATFDTGTFDSVEEAKEWAKGRGQTFEYGEWKDYVVRIRKSDDIYDYIEEYHER